MKTKIKIHSFGTPESLDLRCILEGMYRKMGEVDKVRFPDDNTIELILDGDYEYLGEYGIHEMTRVSPRFEDDRPRTSHVMVEINGKIREEIVCSYVFYPIEKAHNHFVGRTTTDLMYVLSGNPLGMKMKRNENVPAYA